MELRNISKKDFKAIFGKEGYDLVKGYDVNVLVVEAGFMPELDATGYAGGVTGYDFKDGKGPVLTLIINPSAIYATMNDLERASDMRFTILRSYLVHELTHVKQYLDGRLSAIGDQVYWEGEPVAPQTTISEAYATTPWEIEAYGAQAAYVNGSTQEEGVAFFLETIKERFKQAA